jgi:hypothetical protein
MGSKALEGTTVTHGAISIHPKMNDIAVKNGAKWVSVTGVGDSEHVYELGKSDQDIQIKLVGASPITHGVKATLTITWPDATTKIMTNAIAAVDGPTAQLDGAQMTTLTFKKGEA